MIFFKIWYHAIAIIYFVVLKIIYRSRFKVGRKCTWRKGFSVMIEPEGEVVIGSNVFFNNYCSIICRRLVTIGDETVFGENVKIYDHNHHFNDLTKEIKDQGYSEGEVRIGRHCWIASNVVIMKGTYIGDNCVIGAGCVISGHVNDNTIVRNNYKYSEERIRLKNVDEA